MSTSTGQSKPKGISQEEYKKAQESLHNEKFHFDTNQRFQNLQFQMNDLKKNIQDILSTQGSDKRSIDTQLEQIMEATMNSLKEFRQTIGDSKTQIEKMDETAHVNYMLMSQFLIREDWEDSLSHLYGCIERIQGEKDAMRKEFNGLIERLKLDFDQRLQAVKDEILSRPSEVAPLKHLMDQKLELVELNGQNAVLRSSNNERQIALVERKIDNLYQLIKALDITKQEL